MSVKAPKRQLFEVDLEPLAGSRFQPTRFPDLGPAQFRRPFRENGVLKWKDALLVESAQSMANRLEGVGWDLGSEKPVDALLGLPYVRVVAAGENGRYLTSSRTEAHRLASAWVKQATHNGAPFDKEIQSRLNLQADTPLEPRLIAKQIFELDPLCLLHGVFFADKVWPGQPKIARAVSSFVEAVDVSRAVSGGVKRDAVRHELGEAEGSTDVGYGSIPYHRMEYTADRITAYFVIDLAQIASYGLDELATRLLSVIARWEIRSLLDAGLRLRTACDLVPIDDEIRDRAGDALEPAEVLDAEVRRLVGECDHLLGDGLPLEVVWSEGKAKAKK